MTPDTNLPGHALNQGELFNQIWTANEIHARPGIQMIYLVVVKKSPTWTLFTHIKAKRIILKSEIRRIASEIFHVPELNVTVI